MSYNWKIRVQFQPKTTSPSLDKNDPKGDVDDEKDLKDISGREIKKDIERKKEEDEEKEEEMKDIKEFKKEVIIPQMDDTEIIRTKRPTFEKRLIKKTSNKVPIPKYDFTNKEDSSNFNSSESPNYDEYDDIIETNDELAQMLQSIDLIVEEEKKIPTVEETTNKRYIKIKSTPNNISNCVLKWCSWCFSITYHQETEKRYFGRNTYNCYECKNETANCLGCNISMVRSYTNAADSVCFKCDGTYAKYDKKLENLNVIAFCSWCLKKSKQITWKTNMLGRNIFKCESCKCRTLTCRMCSVGVAKSHDKWDDDLCSGCNGTILKWGEGEQVKDTMNKRRGWCSWCVEKTYHFLDETSMFFKAR
eukprot:TRINITY_DN10998_c0_g1_i1.p1 TRINITY_DN10998_c0_g1~~TRINITY_DN10998_c0_g1_i1.p1  ORF type:complete len:362 (+),score=84.19 TRINITY_DN10998_c0_g1_i1:110-1195(+)